ncbi:MAG: MFS transporter [Candidatus Binatia bacterium]|nr:MFS transporter [Candidatus Binatia bacterium]
MSASRGTTSNIGIYMTTFFWGLRTEDLRWFALVGIGAVLALPFVAYVQQRWDKRNILLTVSCLSLFEGLFVINLRFFDVLPENGDPRLLAILIASGSIAAALAVIQGIIGASIVADILDDHELKTGLRQEAMFNAGLSFCGKAVSGFGALFSGLILTMIAFPTQAKSAGGVPAEAIHNLGLIVGLAVPLLYLVPINLIRKYKISRRRHAEIRAQLEERRAAEQV